MRSPDPKQIRSVRRKVLGWYAAHGRDLPWRRTSDPYRILVSELMLQQTQVSRVLPKYRQFLREFPTFRALSAATPGSVLRIWQGLGYNRRALWLHGISRQIMDLPNRRFPRDLATLRTLRGIGEYTASAIQSFAFREPAAVVDVNVRRVLSRVFRIEPRDVSQELAIRCLPGSRAYDWNQGLMDVGSLFCTASSPSCDSCPIGASCRSFGNIADVVRTDKKKEPSRNGIPRRIYRGRVLREVSRRQQTAGRTLALAVGLRSGPADLRWLRSIVETLAGEGLLTFVPQRTTWSVRRLR